MSIKTCPECGSTISIEGVEIYGTKGNKTHIEVYEVCKQCDFKKIREIMNAR